MNPTGTSRTPSSGRSEAAAPLARRPHAGDRRYLCALPPPVGAMGRACSPASYQSNQTLLADRLAVVSLVAWAVNDRGVQVRDRVDAVRRRGRSEVDLEVHVAAGRIAAF